MLGGLKDIEEWALKEFRKRALSEFGDNVSSIHLYGSKARGDFHKESDLDVVVRVKMGDYKLRDRLADIASDVLLEYGVLISPKLIDDPLYNRIASWGTQFFKNITKEGISVE
jgi:predicted nucleotidyltransferase